MRGQVRRIGAGLLIAAGVIYTWILGGQVFSGGADGGGATNAPSTEDVLFRPADYAFSIWGPIYIGFIAWAVYQALSKQEDNPRFDRARPWVVLTALLNAAWMSAVWLQSIWVPVAIIFVMLAAAIVQHQALGIGRAPEIPRAERWLQIPFSLYAGWLTVAAIANTTTALSDSGWNGGPLSETTWGVVMLIVGSAIGLWARFRLRDPIYGAVFVWAFIAIAVEQWERSWPVVVVALVASAVFVGAALFGSMGRLRLSPRAHPHVSSTAPGRTDRPAAR